MWPLAYKTCEYLSIWLLDLRLLHGGGKDAEWLFDYTWRSEISPHWCSDSSPDTQLLQEDYPLP